MAFFHDLPDNRNNRKQKKSDRLQAGGWEEEGTRYRSGKDGSASSGTRYGKDDSRNSRNQDRRGPGGPDRTYGGRGTRQEGWNGTRPESGYSRPGGNRNDRPGSRDQDRRGAGFDRPGRGFRQENRDSGRREPEYRRPGGGRRDGMDPGFRKDSGFRGENPRRPEEPEVRDYRDFEFRDPDQALQEEKIAGEEYILTGRNPIREALKNDRDLEKLLVQKGELSGSAREIVAIAKEKKIMVQVVEKSRLDEIAEHHQGLIAIASAYHYSTVEEILEAAREKGEDPFLILLDGVTDPHNLGAVIRTAECVGAHGVIVPQHRSVGLTPAAVKSSAGAVEHVKVARVTNLNRCIEDLQKKNIWVYGLSMEGEDYEQVSFQGGTALVIGAEGEGISRLTAEKCDMMVSLPIRGKIDSLNASVAAGVMMYRVLSCRNKNASLS